MPSAGPRSPSTVVDAIGIGTIAWANPDWATDSDNFRATASLGNSETSHWLEATNFGFTLPSAVIVNGILVEIELSAGAVDSIYDAGVQSVKGDVLGGTDKKRAANVYWPEADNYISYGGSADLWGRTWLYSDINAATFGVAVAASRTATEGTVSARVDHIRITVYYTAAAGVTGPIFI